MIDREHIKKHFFSDPGWPMVEELIMEFVTPLIQMKDIDLTQPAEHVKAEVIGRMLAHDKLCEFLASSGIMKSANINKITKFN
jgi:hypothetical protein